MHEQIGALTARGRALVVAGVVGLGAGWGLGESAVTAVAVFLLGIPLLGAFIARRSRFVLGSSRTVDPSRFAVGTDAQVVLSIENGSRLPSGVILLEDEVPENLSDGVRVLLDRVPPQTRRSVHYAVTGRERGRGRIGPLSVTVTDPFGTATITRSFSATNPIIVTPRIVDLSDAGRSVAPGGRGETLFRSLAARGDDDVLPREHRPGDDMRRIHWRATAKQGELMVRREEQPWHSSIVVILDNRKQAHVGTGLSSTFEWAVSAAASVTLHYLRRGWQVTALTTTGHLLVHTTGSSSAEIDSALQAFADIRLLEQPMAPRLGAGVEEASAVIAVLGRVTEDAARSLIRPMSAFTGCLLLEPGPIEYLETNGWHTTPWSKGTSVARAWAALMPAVTEAGR
jgi:uncharacterized protein (DUF58 family)